MTTQYRCSVCGHILRFDGVDGYICSARGGCGSEWPAEIIESKGN